MMFNSALAYEMAALKPFAEPLLRQVPFGTPEYIEAKRLLAFLEWFLPLDIDLVPDNSLLREFLGGSLQRILRCGGRGKGVSLMGSVRLGFDSLRTTNERWQNDRRDRQRRKASS